ncbi:MAG: dihydrolipoyl dehydrogenase family protein [Actinomycetota bacterium]
MKENYDVAVIGSGVAGSAAAFECRKNKLGVAVIEKWTLGGTCPNRGCDPKKVLWGVSEIARATTNLRDIFKNKSQLNWEELIDFKKTFTDPVPSKRENAFAGAGIDVYKGEAQFRDASHIEVDGNVIGAKKIIVASGAKPKPLNIPGQHLATTSDRFLETRNLPPSILFIGGGYISFEFAHIASVYARDITILHNDDNPLAVFDKDMVDRLLETTREAGINFVANTPAGEIKKEGDKIIVIAGGKRYPCGMAVHGAERIADIDRLNLEAAGVEYGRGIKVNKYMQSISNDNVYAAGDCIESSPPLTPVASVEAKIAAGNIARGNVDTVDYSYVPSVIFTMPPMASIGLKEGQAAGRGLDFKIIEGDSSSWYNSRRLGLKHTAYKVLEEKNTGKILGAHIIYPHADDLINLFSLAMKNGIDFSDIKDTMFSYPSDSSDIKYML